jgi:hypothetical protein
MFSSCALICRICRYDNTSDFVRAACEDELRIAPESKHSIVAPWKPWKKMRKMRRKRVKRRQRRQM